MSICKWKTVKMLLHCHLTNRFFGDVRYLVDFTFFQVVRSASQKLLVVYAEFLETKNTLHHLRFEMGKS